MKILITIVAALLSTLNPQLSAAPLGTAFTYQGRLKSAGQILSGSYDFKFTLHDAATGGAMVAGPVTNAPVAVTNGNFTVLLDFGAAFSGEARWLEVAVRTNGSASPYGTPSARQSLTPTPYALYAANAATAASAASAGTAPWSGLSGVPAGFADGVDNDTTYTAGTGLSLGGTSLSLNTNYTDGRYWKLGGNSTTTAGTQFLGTTDEQALELKVNNQRALRLEPALYGPNVIAGNSGNSAAPGASGATVLGGQNGYPNVVSATSGTIGGGMQNSIQANASTATIAGGSYNTIQTVSGDSTIGGGRGNTIAAAQSTIGGGYTNIIQTGAFNGVIGGGYANTIQPNASCSTIGGGLTNTIQGGATYAAVGGGYGNTAGSAYATVSGGTRNVASGAGAFVGGGGTDGVMTGGNTASAGAATVSGGYSNTASYFYGTVSGGKENLASAYGATVGGGQKNAAISNYATVPGGYWNVAGGLMSMAAGRQAKALHEGAFVWADSQGTDFSSTSTNQFLIRAGSGVGINKNNPATALDVNGTVTALAFAGSGASLTTLNGGALAAGSVSNGVLAANAVTSDKIADAAIQPADLNIGSFSNVFWRADGNAGTQPDTQFLGTTDNQALELRVNNSRALRLQPNPGGANLVGGHPSNSISTAAEVYGSVIAGGGHLVFPNRIESRASAIGGGLGNVIQSNAVSSTIAGGSGNTVQINAAYSTIAGGMTNTILDSGAYATVGGGFNNLIGIHATSATIAGGANNSIETNADFGTIAGGSSNTIETNAGRSTIGGGAVNTIRAQAQDATIAGGVRNAIQTNAFESAIGGGGANTNTGPCATIPGGQSNVATDYSFAAGRRAKAVHAGSFVWADSTYADFATTADKQFLIRAAGGMGIGTNNPQSLLHVAGTVTATNFSGSGAGLSDLVADQLASGTVPDARLSANVALLNSSPAFSGSVTAGGDLTAARLNVGQNQQLSGASASIAGGHDNTNRADSAVIGGGIENTIDASSIISTISGGHGNTITNNSTAATIGGGAANSIGADYGGAVIAGGEGNTINSGCWDATISGGRNNTLGPDTDYSTIGGGVGNRISEYRTDSATIGGGEYNVIAAWGTSAVIGGGQSNTNRAMFATIAGGANNTIYVSANSSAIGGGAGNVIQSNAPTAVIGGGYVNSIGTNATSSVIAGGSYNAIRTDSSYSFIGGGYANEIQRGVSTATIGGGFNHIIQTNANYATISGGYANKIQTNASFSTIAGGAQNNLQFQARYSFIGGGDANVIQTNTLASMIGGGSANTIYPNADYTTIGGGLGNAILTNADYSTIGGGHDNSATNISATVPGGELNLAGGSYSFAAGRRAKAYHAGTFVWADSTNTDFASTSSNQFLIRASGGVGIGTTAPTRKLQVNDPAAGTLTYPLKISNDGGDTNNTVAGVLFQVSGGGDRGKGSLVYERTATWNRGRFHFLQNRGEDSATPSLADAVVTIETNGFVGIGKKNPGCPLDVSGSALYSQSYGYLNSDGVVGTASGIVPYSIVTSARILATEFNAYSDRRGKQVIGRSDTQADLQTIQQLQVTDYRHIDTIANGSAAKKGFIAQEVETVIPEAVTSSPNFVPNLYCLAAAAEFDARLKTLTLTLPRSHELVVGDKVRLYAGSEMVERAVTQILSPQQFVVENWDKAVDQVFVYGQYVSDYKTLDYDRLFTTGIGAIQELARQVEARETKIARLERDLAELTTVVNRLAQQLNPAEQ